MNTSLRAEAATPGGDPEGHGHRLDAELRSLAHQLQRCGARSPRERVRRLADQLRRFTSRHAISVTAAVALTAAIAGLVS